MKACTFFGHRECPDSIKIKLKEVLIYLITNHDVDMFYVGNQGRFDSIVLSVLRELKKEYPQINYAVVLAYMPGKQTEYDDYSDTMLPEGIESVHPRYAISWRNNWMLPFYSLPLCSKVMAEFQEIDSTCIFTNEIWQPEEDEAVAF